MKSNKSIAQHTSLHQCGKIRHRYRLMPPYRAVISISNRGVQIGIDQRISQNFEYFSCINGDFTDKYGENGGVSAKAIHCKVENDN